MSPLSRRPVGHQLRALVATLCALMLVIALSTALAVRDQSAHVARLTTVIGPATEANRSTLQAMTDAETGLRGYLVSHDPALLQPYLGAEARARQALQGVSGRLPAIRASGEDRGIGVLVPREAAAIDAWWTYARAARARAAAGRPVDVLAGKHLFDGVRAANAELGVRLQQERDDERAASRATVTSVLLVILVGTVLALLVALLAGWRTARALSRPLVDLRRTVERQAWGERDARAREDVGASEVRALATDFNTLTEQNVAMHDELQEVVRLHELAGEVARLVRAAPSIAMALDLICNALGEGLGADRVLFYTVDDEGLGHEAVQWHRHGLARLPVLPASLLAEVVTVAGELWTVAAVYAPEDFLDPQVQQRERARRFHEATSATAVALVPVGLGERVIGVIAVLMASGARVWTDAEVNAMQQLAAYAGRAVVEAEYAAHHVEHVERLERLDRQKTDFLGTVSHELRTPLTSIAGYLELLRDGDAGPVSPAQDRMLEVVDRNTRRLRGLIEDLLVLNRIERGGVHPDNRPLLMEEVVHETMEELRPMADAGGVRLELGPCTAGSGVRGDRGQLHRALVNVVSNAVKFTPGGGQVTVSCIGDEPAGRVRVSVRDTGIGIPADELDLLFARFFRARNATSRAIPGTGLGLAIVRTIVDDHGGELTVTSTEGEGTEVVLHLPQAPASAPELPAASRP